ncbi:hypothetical protein AZE42_12217 [Rhizopogon vesiculosus]|uniref:DUF6699 domain-containing protein n=1 Tax=Rhizopogon vesiculosus TaxID=180088 RepID=A0A1J8QW30_9AGAM|nr:hypothetical protein AZE42_12217 [Rhizopogon vesiculosus]
MPLSESSAQREVSRAYERRCTKMGGGWENGVRRIDLLHENTCLMRIEVDSKERIRRWKTHLWQTLIYFFLPQMTEDGPAYHHLPPHIRYGRSPSVDLFTSTPALHPAPRLGDVWSGGSMHMSMPSLGDFRPMTGMGVGVGRRSVSDSASALASVMPRTSVTSDPSSLSLPNPPPSHPPRSDPDPDSTPTPTPSPNNPDLQLHLYLNWHSNPPTDAHDILIDQLPLIIIHPSRTKARVAACTCVCLTTWTPTGLPADALEARPARTLIWTKRAESDGKPLPAGQRLLPTILIESEISQADKHVLKNVTRIERFIQDVIRKTVEEELVFPNFHTLIVGDQGR